eukprot:Gregarina_sp_Pseudo_9__2525@NODE_27_length_5599_cov_16_826439_g25_i0_p1_GENE_NODE_27_length_5599_cov_16_826439_g25_i0NODE_27_length_5599_cov_16_826439_g25_i0_p1_ORF_typecomplete_len623_score151_19Peptidase_M14/PF00246_24/4_8e38AstE_AspA/PF04952_14/0_08_NODE_27_length_5599_cov_16_826439_g25_i020873955
MRLLLLSSLLAAQSALLQYKEIDGLINNGTGTHYGGYPSFSETIAILDTLAETNPLLVKSFVAGISVECRPLHLYMLTGLGLRMPSPSFKTHIQNIERALATQTVREDRLLVTSCASTSNDTFAEFWTRMLNKWSAEEPVAATTPVKDQGSVLMTAVHHAREPTSLTVPLNLFFFLTHWVGNWTHAVALERPVRHMASVAAALVAHRDVYLLPFVNPDGYVAIERGGDINIRKNRRRTCGQRGPRVPLSLEEALREKLHPLTDSRRKALASDGVDLNRNYDNSFAVLHSGCDLEEYEGPFAFSEPETRAVRRIAAAVVPKIALNFHSYGNVWTHPYNCCPGKSFRPGDEDVFREIKECLNITSFGSAPEQEVLGYTTTGEADDYLYDEFGIISMSPEVGPEEGGFYPKTSLIRTINIENLAVILKVIVKAGPQISGKLASCEGLNQPQTLHLRNDGLANLSAGRVFIRPVSQDVVDLIPASRPGDHLRLSLGNDAGSRLLVNQTQQTGMTLPEDNASQSPWIWKVVSSGLGARKEVSLEVGEIESENGWFEVCFRVDPETGETAKFVSNIGRDALAIPPVCHCGWLQCASAFEAFILAPSVHTAASTQPTHPCSDWSLGADE